MSPDIYFLNERICFYKAMKIKLREIIKIDNLNTEISYEH